jgi:chemotaxis protein CheD
LSRPGRPILERRPILALPQARQPRLPKSLEMPPRSRPTHDGRFGAFAMQRLIDALLELGASQASLEAKVFGGGQIMAGMDRLNVGERNTRFVLDDLRSERIPVVGMDVLGVHPRKLCFLPCSGKAMVKRLAPTHAVVERERTVARRVLQAGSIDPF